MPEPLALHQVEALRTVGPRVYRDRVIALFLTHRATPEMYAAMADAVLHWSESAAGALVACIDRAVLTPCPLCGEPCETFADAGKDPSDATP